MKIIFYTCFFGNDRNEAYKIPEIPSLQYECYYFTNNINIYNELKKTKWISIFIKDIPIKNNLVKDAFDSKLFKSCPHLLKQLQDCDYTCYFDSKINISCDRCLQHIENMNKLNKLMLLPKHPFIKNNVWDEYNEAITHSKYNIEKNNYTKYINHQLTENKQVSMPIHYTTQFIIRKNCNTVNTINETWYKHIKDCGIMCQISFFFIQQIFNEYILDIDYYDGYKHYWVK